MRTLIILLFLCSSAFAQELTTDASNNKIYVDSKGTKYSTTEVSVGEKTRIKPNIDANKVLSKEEKEVVNLSLHTGQHFIQKRLTAAKNDYINNKNAGTVEFNPINKNYSYHKVIIPDGTTLIGINFTQDQPHTEAIFGKDLIFVDCNITNVEVDPTWELINTHERHRTREIIKENGRIYEVTKRDFGDGKFVEIIRSDITPDTSISDTR